jgi:hypothetical protein
MVLSEAHTIHKSQGMSMIAHTSLEDSLVVIELKYLRQFLLIPCFENLKVIPNNITQIVSHNIQSLRNRIKSVTNDKTRTLGT